ncbi:MAG: AsmA family protein [Gammaproteobacteria bacterium]|nr:AsmA family protein [Gammaproteobacteria bacterium]
MRKFIRYFLIGLGAVILLSVASMAIFIAVFDANAYKEDISKLVHEQTGRELQFQGDIGLTIFPALGMELGSMSFSNAAGFGELPMARVGLVSVSVDFVSLLRFAPEIDKLILHDLEINLIRNRAGVNNWDDLVKQSGAGGGDAAGSTSTTQSKPAGSKANELELKGALAGVEIDNLKLLWLDQQAGEEYRITDLDISTGRIAPNESFPMNLHLDASVSGDLDIVFDLNTTVEYLIKQQQLTLSEMKLELNEFEIGGRLQVSNFSKPALRFDLASELLDIDALLDTPPASVEQSSESGQQAGAGSGSGEPGKADEDIQITLPMQTLRDLDIDGDLRIANLKVQNLKITDLELHLSAQSGLVSLKPMRMKTYGGTVVTNLVVDVKGDLPKYGINKTVKGIQVGDMLDDYMGESPIGGNFNAGVNLTTSGEWLSKLKKNSNGTMSLAFLDGALNGVNIRQSIDAAKAKFKGEDPPEEKTRKTDFSSLTISGVVKNGVFSSDDLDLQAPLLRAGGKGSADLNREFVDYLVNTKLVGTSKGQEGGTADDLAGLSIPVHIKGPFTDPKIDVQLDEILKARIEAEKAKLKARVEAEKAKLKAEFEAEKAKLKAKAEAKKAELEAEIETQKKALEKQLEAEKRALEAEKKALEEAQKRELEIKIELEKARAKKKLEDKLKKLFD